MLRRTFADLTRQFTTPLSRNMTTQAIPAAHRHLDAAIQRLLPLSLADTSWDNVGWMVQTPEPRQVEPGTKQRVLLCIDRETLIRARVRSA